MSAYIVIEFRSSAPHTPTKRHAASCCSKTHHGISRAIMHQTRRATSPLPTIAGFTSLLTDPCLSKERKGRKGRERKGRERKGRERKGRERKGREGKSGIS